MYQISPPYVTKNHYVAVLPTLQNPKRATAVIGSEMDEFIYSIVYFLNTIMSQLYGKPFKYLILIYPCL